MKAEIEPLCGIIRVWVDNLQYGDPYEWVATVRWLSRDKIEILGYTTKVTPSIWKAVIKECQRKGVISILAVLYKNRVRHEKVIKVPSLFENLH